MGLTETFIYSKLQLIIVGTKMFTGLLFTGIHKKVYVGRQKPKHLYTTPIQYIIVKPKPTKINR